MAQPGPVEKGSLGPVMDIATDDRFFIAPSVDKKNYAERDPLNPIRGVSAQEAAVFNGNFFTDFGERFYQGLRYRIPRAVGTYLEVKGRRMVRVPDFTDEEDRADQILSGLGSGFKLRTPEQKAAEGTFGNQLINFGLHMTEVADEALRQRQEDHPVINKGAMFLADVSSSLLVSIGLAKVGGPLFAGIVLGGESGLGITKGAMDAGKDVDTAITFGAFTGAAVTKLEQLGLSAVFNRTMGKGMGVVSRYVLEAMTAEGLTEGLQTSVELGAGVLSGAQKDLTFESFLNQVIYSSAVGAFAGGGMVAAVAVPQRARAINASKEVLGLDTETATRLVDGAMQQAQVSLMEDMSEEFGFGDVQNRAIQTIRDIANLATGEGVVTREQATLAIEQLLGTQPITAILGEMRAIAGADVQAEIDQGKIKGRRVKGKKAAQQAQLKVEDQVEPVDLPPFEPIVAEIDNKMGPDYKVAVQTRLAWIKGRVTELKKGLVSTMKLLEKKAAVKGQKIGDFFRGPAYRAETGLLVKGKTAQEIVDFEAKELGNEDIKKQAEAQGLDLSTIPENRVVWVTGTRKAAQKYGEVTKYNLPEGSKVIATDGDGGYLVVLPVEFFTELQEIRDEVDRGEAGYRIRNETSPGVYEWIAVPSTFPGYFKNKGWSKKSVLNILDKALASEQLTEKQQGILDELLVVARDKRVEFQEEEAAFLAQRAEEKAQGIDFDTTEFDAPQPSQLERRMERISDEYATLINEYNAIAQDPNNLQFEAGGQIKATTETLQRLGLHKIKTILAEVNKNFRLGRKSVMAELAYVKGVLNSLINQPGVKKTQRYQLQGVLRQIRTPEQLEGRIAEVETRVQDMIDENLITTFRTSIDSSIAIMKGKGTKKRKTNLLAKSQKLADTFNQALKEVDIDPGVEADKIHTPEGFMRTLAAMYKTEKNTHGQDLSAKNYAWIERSLRNFVERGSLEFVKEKETRKRVNKELVSKVIGELAAGKVSRTTVAGQGLEFLLNETIKLGGNYDVMIGALVKGMGEEAGGTVFRAAMDSFTGLRVAETNRAYFTSQFKEGAKKIYGLKSALELNEKLMQDGIDMIQIFDEDENGMAMEVWNKPRSITREKYMLWLSPDGKKILKWGKNLPLLIEKALGPQDMQFIHLQLAVYAEMYDSANAVYRKANLRELPRREFYSTIYREGFNLDTKSLSELVVGERVVDPNTGEIKYLRPLTQNDRPLKDISDYTKMLRYIDDMSHYIGMAETADRIQFILKEARDQIIESKGEGFYKNLKRYSDVLIKNSAYTDASDLHKGFNKAVTNFNKMVLAAKPVLFAKQMVSSMAALDRMGVTEYSDYIFDIGTALKDGRLDKLLSNPFFAARGMKKSISRDLKEITETFEREIVKVKDIKRAKRNIKMNHYMFLMTQLGDMGGIVLNGWAVYQHNLKALKMSEAQAVTNAIRHINETQQSTDYTQMSTFALKTDPLSRSITAFTHAPLQYVNKILEQLSTVGTEGFNAKKFGQTYVVYGILLNVLFNAIGRGFRWEKEDRPEYIAEAALGPFDRLYLVGPILRWAVANATFAADQALTEDEDIKKPRSLRAQRFSTFTSMYDNIADAERAVSKVLDEDVLLEDFFGAITQLSEALGPVAGTYAGIGRAAGGAAQGITAAVEENNEGSFVNSWRRLLMVAGYSEYATRPGEE